MTPGVRFAFWWGAGLALFALALWLHLPLAIPAVPGGILDHQAAGSAAEVDRIQQAWRAAGLSEQARMAMICDLVFIGTYAFGSLLGGFWLRSDGRPVLRLFGDVVIATAIVFCLCDYTETICEFVQLVQDRGSDALAAAAATARPVKVVAWLASFFGVIAGLAVRRFAQ